MYTHFNTDAVAAFEAPVTEVAFYTLPTDGYNADLKAKIDEGMHVPSMDALTIVGKSSGSAVGWGALALLFI